MNKISFGPTGWAALVAVGICLGATAAGGAEATKAGSQPASSQAAAPADPRVEAVLRKIEGRYKDLKSLSGEFGQEKSSETFVGKTESQGQFWYLPPDRFRCDFKPPYESVNLIVDNMAYVATKSIKQVETFTFDDAQKARQHVNQLLLGVGIAVKEILDTYEVAYLADQSTADLEALMFTPKSKEGALFDSMVLWVTSGKAEAKKLLIREGEDETRITIRKITENPRIEAKVFEPKFKAEWKGWDVVPADPR